MIMYQEYSSFYLRDRGTHLHMCWLNVCVGGGGGGGGGGGMVCVCVWGGGGGGRGGVLGGTHIHWLGGGSHLWSIYLVFTSDVFIWYSIMI